jgi:hypothetical protein
MWPRLLLCVRRSLRCDGSTLVEVLVATALFTGGLAGVAQLFALVSRSTVVSRDISYASASAAQKLNELASDELALLTVSSPDAWMRTESDHVEYLDTSGRVVAVSGAPPGAAIYVRRWSITPLPGDATGGVVLQVSVGRLRRQPSDEVIADALPSEVARVVGIRTGTAP